MAAFLIRNSLNPQKVVRCGITFEQQTLKGASGEAIWIVELATLESHKDGGEILPEYIHLRTLDNLDAEIEKAAEKISVQISWEPLVNDVRAPFVAEYFPSETTGVSIDSNIVVKLVELLPSAGIDLSSVKVMLDGFDITNEVDISGDPYNYILKWKPPIVVYDVYK